ncbi:TetR/AcrR family transcriptional regulator [Kosmotoga pacifica]|uniref:TetR family transcriptional regulator n=1 Tax=Kosmotoga pacifica TaxID=1330330 RepID=A0A0G2ZC51_9BACT|nr:TetR/AcrR family transcriptional regulator [Kosmotoga pacifica]AKI97144.1 TetR family transcriptional regulator [Kosmotoga pacifica]
MRGEVTRKKIMEAAIKVISQETIEGLSTRKVSGEADVNLAAIHYHHRSKEGMLIDLSRYVINNYLLPKIDALFGKGLEPRDFISSIFNIINELSKEREDVLITLIYLWLYGKKNKRIREIMRSFKSQIEERMKEELLKHMSKSRTSRVIFRLSYFIFGYTLELVISGETITEKEIADIAKRIL